MANNYHSKLDKRYKAKLRVLEGQLPFFCTQYFNAKAYAMEKQTAFAYATDFKTFFEFIKGYIPKYKDVPVKNIPASLFDELTSHDMDIYIDKYLDEIKHNGENAVQRKISSIKSLCKYLVKEGIIQKSPAELIDSPKIHKKEILTLSNKEVDRLFYYIENSIGMTDHQIEYNKKWIKRDYAIIMLFLGTGMRISELAGLDLQDINLDENIVHIVRKGGNEQYIYFSPQIAEAIKKYLGYGRYSALSGTRLSLNLDPTEKALFISSQKHRLSVRGIQCLIAKYSELVFDSEIKKVNKDYKEHKLHAHLFRKTYGTNLYLEKNDIKLVQDTLGHSNISTTERHYVVNSPERKKMAAIDVIKRKEKK